MTFQIRERKEEQRQLMLTVEVTDDRFERAERKIAREFARRYRIPGFRPGKAPLGVVRRMVGEEQLQAEALQELLPQLLREIVEELDVDLYATPDASLVERSPLTLDLVLPLRPIVELGDYRATRKQIEPVEISEDAVEERLQLMRQQQAGREMVDRPAQAGDSISYDCTAWISEGEEEPQEQDYLMNDQEMETRLVEEDNPFPGSSFVEELIGLRAGEAKDFRITLPDDFDDETLAGAEVAVNVRVEDVFELQLPELDDEFAKQQEGDYETLDELHADLRKRMQEQAEEQQREDILREGIDELIENVEVLEYPPAAVEAEIDALINRLKGQLEQAGLDWDRFVNQGEFSLDNMREEYEEQAVTSVERQLVIQQFIRQEGLLLSQEDIDTAIDSRVAEYANPGMEQYVREYLSEGQGRDMLVNELGRDRIVERLLAIYRGEAPDLEIDDADEEPQTTEQEEEELTLADDVDYDEAAAAHEE